LFHSYKFPFDGGAHLSLFQLCYQTNPVGFDQIAGWDFWRFLANPAGFKTSLRTPGDKG